MQTARNDETLQCRPIRKRWYGVKSSSEWNLISLGCFDRSRAVSSSWPPVVIHLSLKYLRWPLPDSPSEATSLGQLIPLLRISSINFPAGRSLLLPMSDFEGQRSRQGSDHQYNAYLGGTTLCFNKLGAAVLGACSGERRASVVAAVVRYSDCSSGGLVVNDTHFCVHYRPHSLCARHTPLLHGDLECDGHLEEQLTSERGRQN
jgi:hypothetical protein